MKKDGKNSIQCSYALDETLDWHVDNLGYVLCLCHLLYTKAKEASEEKKKKKKLYLKTILRKPKIKEKNGFIIFFK